MTNCTNTVPQCMTRVTNLQDCDCVNARIDAAYVTATMDNMIAIETQFWSIVDREGLSGLPSDMWEAIEIMARHYRNGTAAANG